MALNPRLELRQEQRLALTPAVRVRLSVLRMSPTDLDEEIAREVARNPFLVVDAPRGGAQSLPLADDLAAPVQSFHEDLRRQLALMDLSSPVRAAALLLVGELGEDGLLGTDIDTLAAFRTKAPGMPYAHPTVEHFTPLFLTLGAASDASAAPTQVIDGYWLGLAKRSFQVA